MKRDDIVEYKFKRYYDIIKTCSNIEQIGEIKMCKFFECVRCCVESCSKITIKEIFMDIK